jgi:2,4-dienoyl-CoA reductase-like NADH-dependent reductase (Old Yellow Enzyme family)
VTLMPAGDDPGLLAGAGRYPYLFAPLRVGSLTVSSRVVFSAHLTNYAQGGLPSEQHAACYAARAAGGPVMGGPVMGGLS